MRDHGVLQEEQMVLWLQMQRLEANSETRERLVLMLMGKLGNVVRASLCEKSYRL